MRTMSPMPEAPAVAPEHRLIPALLVASAVNAEGNVDLAAGDGGPGGAQARAEFYPGDEGELYQRRYWRVPSRRFSQVVVDRRGEEEPLDMAFFAACLARTFGGHTPPLFRLAAPEPGQPGRFAMAGEERDRERLAVLRHAFSIFLLAYEERLI